MKDKNILYLSYDGMTDPLGQAQVIPYLIGLSKKGYRFSLLSFEKKHHYENHKNEVQDTLAQHHIDWHPLVYHKNPPVFSTLYDLWKLWKTVSKIYRQDPFSMVHCRSYITALVGLSLKKKYGVKFIFDMRGFWADERVDGKIWNLKNPVFRLIYRFFKKKEKQFLNQADYTISLTEAGKREIHSWGGLERNPVPIEVIPCCADLKLFSPGSVDAEGVERFKKALGIQPDDFLLLYLGAIGTWYMLDEMLDFFKCLSEKNPKAKFLFVTKESPVTIHTCAKEKDIELQKLLVIAANREEVPSLIGIGKLAIFFIKPVFSKKASSPTKQGEIMGMGIPIVCNDGVGDCSEIIRETQAGKVIKEFGNESYSEAIENLDQILNIPAEDIRLGAERYYALEAGIQRYHQVYQKMIS